MAPETEADLELLRDAAREVSEREKPLSKARFGPKPSGLHDDRLSTKAAPGPVGPPAKQFIEEAKRRRRERAEEERKR